MYFPKLTHLEEYNIDRIVIAKLDLWLSKLSGRTRKGIRPARFSVDMDVDFNLANEIFSLSATKLKIFNINYEVYCPCDIHELVASYTKLDDIPEALKCSACGQRFNPYEHDEFIEITFDLIIFPDPSGSPKATLKTDSYDNIRPIRKRPQGNLSAKAFLSGPLGREEIDNTLFQPNWEAFDEAHERLKASFCDGVSTDEKGKALENISSLSLSFVTFFRVDSTVHTQTNQIDVTITIKPYFKYIEIPLLNVMCRRILCECKNEDNNVPSQWVDKLAAGIDKVDSCRVGVIFSRHTFSGDDWKFARASQIEHARLQKYILSITKEDFEEIRTKRLNILQFLDDKFEELEMRITKRAL